MVFNPPPCLAAPEPPTSCPAPRDPIPVRSSAPAASPALACPLSLLTLTPCANLGGCLICKLGSSWEPHAGGLHGPWQGSVAIVRVTEQRVLLKYPLHKAAWTYASGLELFLLGALMDWPSVPPCWARGLTLCPSPTIPTVNAHPSVLLEDLLTLLIASLEERGFSSPSKPTPGRGSLVPNPNPMAGWPVPHFLARPMCTTHPSTSPDPGSS